MSDDPDVLDITGLDKELLLHSLWQHQQCGPYFLLSLSEYDHANAKATIASGWIDYYCGRAIKMNLSRDTVNVRVYNQDSAVGAGAAIAHARNMQLMRDTKAALAKVPAVQE
jgi:hypothetical protein